MRSKQTASEKERLVLFCDGLRDLTLLIDGLGRSSSMGLKKLHRVVNGQSVVVLVFGNAERSPIVFVAESLSRR